jgi:hypothetical protein
MKKRTIKKGEIQKLIKKPIAVVLDNDLDRFSNGWMIMAITEAKISLDGKEVGSIRFDVGGTTVQGLIGSRAWSISIKELWSIFCEADQEYMEGQR